MKTELYFYHCQTTTEVKKLYRELALEHHPDRGGNTATMQIINKQYQEALKRLDGKAEMGTDGKERTYTYNPAKEEEIASKLQELLALNLEDVEFWLIGRWIWSQGNTKPHKESLKKCGMTWAPNREAWVWKPSDEPRSRKSNGSLDDLAEAYGSSIHKPAPKSKGPVATR